MRAIAILPVYANIHPRLRAAMDAIGLDRIVAYGASDLPKARSMLITDALRTEAERVVFLDADMAPTADQLRALIADERVDETHAMSALYATRDQSRWAISGKGEAGLGCSIVDARSLRRLAAALPKVQTDDQEWYPFCVPFVLKGPPAEYVPEDYSLWRRLRSVGCELLINTGMIVGHMGEVEIRAPLTEAKS